MWICSESSFVEGNYGAKQYYQILSILLCCSPLVISVAVYLSKVSYSIHQLFSQVISQQHCLAFEVIIFSFVNPM